MNCCFPRRFYVATALGAALILAGAPAPAMDWVPAPSGIAAEGYLLVDYESGTVIAEKNADRSFEPASLTKLMTAYLVYQALAGGTIRESDEVLVSEKAWRTEGSRMFIEVNKRVAVSELLMGIVVQSGNDASVALAEHIGGSEEIFVRMMNEKAAEMGLQGSHFVNATGLPHPDHHMTAYDIAKLSRALIRDFPEYYKSYAVRDFTYNNIRQHNRNKLLWRDPTVDGLKTGYTESAGYCLAASAKRDGMRLVSVVLGSASDKKRFEETIALLRHGFRFYQTFRLFETGQVMAEVRVWGGEQESLKLGVPDDFYMTLPKSVSDQARTELSVHEDIFAPVQQGQVLGMVKVFVADRLLHEKPLTALHPVSEGGFFSRMMDKFIRLF